MSDGLGELGRKWAEAERTGNVAALDGLLGDEFRGVGPLGFVLTKEAWLGRYESGALVHERFDWEPREVRVFGDTAVVIGNQFQKSAYQGRDIEDGRLRLTQVLIRRGGAWKLVSIHIGNLADAAA